MYYKFQPTAAIIMYKKLSQPAFFLSAIPPYISQCLHIGSAAYVMPLWHKIY
jgi:hypothetical protein